MKLVSVVLTLLCCLIFIASTCDASQAFTQYNATRYLYQNQSSIATWESLPFSSPVKQVLWYAPLKQFLLFFEDQNPYAATVEENGTLSFSQCSTNLMAYQGAATVVNDTKLYYAAVWGFTMYAAWCEGASLNCTHSMIPLPQDWTFLTTVYDLSVRSSDGFLVMATDGGLLLANVTQTSSMLQFIEVHNTTGAVGYRSHVSKVHVRSLDNTIFAASNEYYTTSNCWTTDLVHVVKGMKETYFYRTPGIIDAIPTAFVRDPYRGGTHFANEICDNFLYDNGTFQRISGAFQGNLPQRNITCGAFSSTTNNVWFGSALGVMMLRPDGTWKYFFGPRWLPGEGFTTGMHVFSLAVAPSPQDGSEVVLVATDTGLSLIYTITWESMATKAAFYQAQMPRFIRYGLVSQLGLAAFGDTTQYTQQTTANDGLWSSIYLGSQCFRFASTGDEDARTEAWNTFDGMQLLVNVTGDPGYPARSFIQQTPCPNGLWPSVSMPGYCWQGETSSDEIVGHLHGYALLYFLVAQTDAEKSRVATTIHNILGGIVRNNFTLVGAHSGNQTQWGRWDPSELNYNPYWYDERGVNSNQILTYLVTGYAITEDPMFAEAFWYLVNSEQYDENIIDLKITQPSDINYSDDELTFLPYLSFLFGSSFSNGTSNPLYERLAHNVWLSIERSHGFVAKEKPSLYNAIFAGVATQIAGIPMSNLQLVQAASDALWWMKTYTVWQVDWPTNNKDRIDNVFPINDIGRSTYGDGKDRTLVLFPYDETTMLRWNSNPFDTKQGSGYSELDPSPFLYAYWVGRYFRVW